MAKLNINGKMRDVDVEGDTPLLWVLREDNFHNYQVLKLAEMPKVETVLVPTYDFWGGVGEPTICVVAPSVLNAVHAATGKPVRNLPLKNTKLA